MLKVAPVLGASLAQRLSGGINPRTDGGLGQLRTDGGADIRPPEISKTM